MTKTLLLTYDQVYTLVMKVQQAVGSEVQRGVVSALRQSMRDTLPTSEKDPEADADNDILLVRMTELEYDWLAHWAIYVAAAHPAVVCNA